MKRGSKAHKLYKALIAEDYGSHARYEGMRETLIEDHGYYTFRAIQSVAFREIMDRSLDIPTERLAY